MRHFAGLSGWTCDGTHDLCPNGQRIAQSAPTHEIETEEKQLTGGANQDHVMRSIAVVGAGIAGMSTALLLARLGLAVDLFERDATSLSEDNPVNTRRGAPQSSHPHVFLGYFRKLLRENLPDVFAELGAMGIREYSFHPEAQPAADRDPDLVMMAATRGAIERALTKVVEVEPGISFRKSISIEDVIRDERTCQLALAIHGTGESHQGYDLVVDASGARSRWNRKMLDTVTSADCGTVYNTRFFRLPDGGEQPELRYGTVTVVDAFAYGAALFQHEDGIFSIDIARLPGDRGLYRLRENECFDAAAAVFTEFKPWLGQIGCRAITNATPMAGLRNVIRRLASSAPAGYVPIGDGICTTDPTYGRGVALALGQAVMLRDRMADRDLPLLSTPGQNRVFVDDLGAYVRPWYDDVVEQDIGRTKLRVAAIRGEDPMSIIQASEPIHAHRHRVRGP